MTPRDWVATGAAVMFGAVGLVTWRGAIGPDAAVLTVAGAVPLTMALAALYALVRER